MWCRESARIAALQAADGPPAPSGVCRCVAPQVEPFWGIRQCAVCHRPFAEDLSKAVTAA